MKNTKETIVLALCLSLIFSPSTVFAAPQGGKVVGGSAHMQQSGATTTINQNSDRAIINWHSFDIGKNEAVRHNMPSAKSAGLHRVVGGGGASQIQGLLQSNGNVYLVNPAGVVIHKGARVDTNGFIATTRDIADSNFMKGNMAFDRPGRPDAQIVNQGTISVRESGLAALVAPTVRNEGLIAGKLGKVALASGDATWKLDMHGDDLITFTVNEKDVNALHTTDGTPLAGVENSGSIKAEGGMVVLTAAQLDGIVGSVVNSGEVSAASAEFKGGKITFRGEGSQVDVRNSGTVDASSARADGGEVRMVTDGAVTSSGAVVATGGQKGGKAVLTGREVALTGTAKIDVSGNTGGGTALVGGNALGKGSERNARTARVESGAAIHADATAKGDGGQVVVWSDEKTSFDGTITARGGSEGGNGGQVETSGKSLKIGNTAKADASAPKGIHGEWLLDPVDFVIAGSGGDMTGATVSANLATGNVTIKSSDGKNDGNGDIFVNDAVSWSSDNTLTLDAYRNVNVNADITATSANAGLVILPQNGVYNLGKARLTLSGSSPRLTIGGHQYTVINSLQALQDMNNNLGGYYALGSDIDASATACWNNGRGFEPIGYRTQYIDDTNGSFYGIVYGLGHEIQNLTINRPKNDQIGFFVKLAKNSKVYDLIFSNIFIRGLSRVGALTSYTSNSVLIKNVHISGNSGCDPNLIMTGLVQGENIGGIVGSNSGKVINCSFSGKIDGGTYNVGGIAGLNSGEIVNSYSSVSIVGHDGSNMGGLVGRNYDGDIKNSYSISSVIGKCYVGGLVGYMNNGTIYNSYSYGFVSALEHAGGFIGGTKKGPMYSVTFDNEINDIINCYWNIDRLSSVTNGLGYDVTTEVGGNGTTTWSLAGLTEDQMKSQQSFIGWDFDNIWAIDEGHSYPFLRVANVHAMPTPTPTPDPEPTPTPDPVPELTPTPTNDFNDRIPPEKEIIYVDGKDAIEIELDEDNNKVIVVLSDEQAAAKKVQEEFSVFLNTIEDGILELKQWTSERNQKIFEIYSAKSVFSLITEAIVHIGAKNPIGILSSIGEFLTDSELVEAGLNLILSEYFFHESIEETKKAEAILNKNEILDIKELNLAINHLIDSRVYALSAVEISKEKIEEISKIANYPFPLEVLYWSADIAKSIGENLLISGLKIIGRSSTNIQLGVLDDGSIREIPALLTVNGQIKNIINQSMPYIEGVLTVNDYLDITKKLINNTVEGSLINDGLLNNLINLSVYLNTVL